MKSDLNRILNGLINNNEKPIVLKFSARMHARHTDHIDAGDTDFFFFGKGKAKQFSRNVNKLTRVPVHRFLITFHNHAIIELCLLKALRMKALSATTQKHWDPLDEEIPLLIGLSRNQCPSRLRASVLGSYKMATFFSRICKTPITPGVQVAPAGLRFYAFSGYRNKSRIKVCVIGADSAVGAPLATLLQRSKLIDDIALYGNIRPERLAAELCCIPERPEIQAFGSSNDGLYCALKGAQLVLLAEGAFRNSIKREDHFRTHAKSACEYGKAIGEEVPNALVGVLTNPISAILPVVWECIRRSGGRQPERRVMGVATLPAARVAAQAARVIKADPVTLKVYIGGGTCGATAVPLLSALDPQQRLTQLEASSITASIGTSGRRIRRALQQSFGSIMPCKAYPGDSEDCGDCAFGGHTGIGMFLPTFSIAHATNKFVDAAVRAISGHRCVETNAFVVTQVSKNDAEFATVPVMLGQHGVLKILPLPTPSEGEASLLEASKESLRRDLLLAKDFLTAEFGPSERPQVGSDQCPGYDEGAVNIFNACGERFYPESSPPCQKVW